MEWVKIRDFTNYSVSEYGDVRNDETGKILAKTVSKYGYVVYRLSKNGKTYNIRAHRLVAKHFLNKVQGKEIVNHIDENKENNHFSNLEWCTQRENINHGTRTERMSKTKSKAVAQYDLQGNLLNIFCSGKEAKRKTGVNNRGISKCCSGSYKTSGGFIWEYTSRS